MLQRVVFLLSLWRLWLLLRPPLLRERRPADPSPFAHAPCSVLDSGPCTPSVCSPLDHGPCNPEINYPIGENLQVTIVSKPDEKDAAKYQKPDHDLDTIGDLFAALRSCDAAAGGCGARRHADVGEVQLQA